MMLGHPEGVVAALVHAFGVGHQRNDPSAPVSSPAAAATGNELPRMTT
jgi:hypothetical protein